MLSAIFISTGNNAWLLISAALVLFMTFGLALFYGGLVNSKNVLAIIMQNVGAIAIITILWVLGGFSLSFSHSILGGILGNLSLFGLNSVSSIPYYKTLTVSPYSFISFQLMFAIITAALISGGVAERMKLSAYLAFVSIWLYLVYSPIAHLAFSPGGAFAHHGLMDFAGGTVVEINSGFSTLGLVLAIGPRRQFKEIHKPHSLPLSLIGLGILWFGWFGFNAGSAIEANSVASIAFFNTQLAACAAVLTWMALDKLREGVTTTLGAASGALAGLVAITPAAGFVEPYAALIIGVVGSLVAYLAISFKTRLGFDDTLDVLSVHGIAGFFGTVLVGLFAATAVNPQSASGLINSGNLRPLIVQLTCAILTALYALIISYLIAKMLDRLIGLRVDEEAEYSGLDISLHAENAYSP